MQISKPTSACIGNHGVTNFPDPQVVNHDGEPTAQDDLSVEMVRAQGIDVHSPTVLNVLPACLSASHGALTPAEVRAALNNTGG